MDDQRLDSYVDQFEKFITRVLLVMMAMVVVLATIELGWVIVKDVLTPPILMLELEELLQLFGTFLLVLIGIELLHSVRVYLANREVHLRAVLTVALIAIARKIVIIDPTKLDHMSLVGIGCVVFALTVAYYLTPAGAPYRASADKTHVEKAV